jgi:FAD/FMN-containing dehydrogenase
VTDRSASRSWAATLKGDVILPVDIEHAAEGRLWNLNIDRGPAAIVRCADTYDGLRTVEFARAHRLIVAVRSGGHNLAWHSMCDGGVVIDLGWLNQAEVDPQSRVAHVMAGPRAGAMLDAVVAMGLATPSGAARMSGLAD